MGLSDMDVSKQAGWDRAAGLWLPSKWQWWPMGLPLCAIGLIYVSHPLGFHEFFGRRVQDDTPLPYVLSGLALAVFVIRACRHRCLLMVLMAAMAAGILGREIHYEGSTVVAFATLAACIAVGWWRYEAIKPALSRGAVARWILMTGLAYVLAVAVAKGWLKWVLPTEGKALWWTSTPVDKKELEETLENVAHLMLLATALMGWHTTEAPRTPPPGEP